MIITSTQRCQRQFRSTFVDAFEAQKISIVSSRRVRSDHLHTAVKHDQLHLRSDQSSLTFLDLDLATDTGRNVPDKLAENFGIVNETVLIEDHFSRLSCSFQGISTGAEFHKPLKASQPTVCSLPTNDVYAPTKISLNVCSNTTSCEKEIAKGISNEIQQLLSAGKIKSPAQKEWEKLWYHGIDSAFQKVASYFPETEPLSQTASTSLSISEPVLKISGLRQEDRQLFEQEEKNHTQTFIPRTEADRIARLNTAETVVNSREKAALLLGLPTYKQYLVSKLYNQQKINEEPSILSKRQQRRQARFAEKKQSKADRSVKPPSHFVKAFLDRETKATSEFVVIRQNIAETIEPPSQAKLYPSSGMTHQQSPKLPQIPIGGAEHRPLVVGLTKPQSTRSTSTMASSAETAALNKEIAENVKENTAAAAPAEGTPTAPSASKPKKEKTPKQPKPQKAAPVSAPTAPALIDLRVGHILRAIAHPNADSLYVSTIAMGDPEGTEHTQVDEETGKVVRTVCSGLNGLIPLEEMQDRKIIVVANLKPVNMRSIKSAAMVLAASPKQPEGADSHAPDRVVELVIPPEGAEAGDKVYFEGWPYGEDKGPEKQLNPKKKHWEAIQPGFFTGDDLVVGFDASQCEEVEGNAQGNLVVEGKGVCTVKTLKGAIVR